jgi:hypothetical protein
VAAVGAAADIFDVADVDRLNSVLTAVLLLIGQGAAQHAAALGQHLQYVAVRL